MVIITELIRRDCYGFDLFFRTVWAFVCLYIQPPILMSLSCRKSKNNYLCMNVEEPDSPRFFVAS